MFSARAQTREDYPGRYRGAGIRPEEWVPSQQGGLRLSQVEQ